MTNFSFVIGLAFALSLMACNKKTELFEVEIPERGTFENTSDIEFPNPAIVKTTQGPFEMEGLPYLYDQLIPFLSPDNVEIHYSKHHLGYANNLNKNILATQKEDHTLEELLRNLDPEDTKLRNNLGGFYNHNIYWKSITPKTNTIPSDALLSKISQDFGSMENFKSLFSKKAESVFGSGWVWLVKKNGKLDIVSTANQDTPLMPFMYQGYPLLALDLWEHAYYPSYQNDRNSYIKEFILHIDWDYVSDQFDKY